MREKGRGEMGRKGREAERGCERGEREGRGVREKESDRKRG